MPAALSLDLRLRIVGAVERGSSIRAAARRFAVSPSAAIKLMQRVRTTGSALPARFGGQRRPLLAPYEADIRRLLEPGLVREYRRRLTERRQAAIAFWSALKRPVSTGVCNEQIRVVH